MHTVLCLWHENDSEAYLAFAPKVVGPCFPIGLAALATSLEEQRASVLCPGHAACAYMDMVRCFRRSCLAYLNQGLQPHAGPCAYSAQSMATSWAFFRGMDLWEIIAEVS